ncbi:pyridoxal 5'-phosphate synthase glutaminase subunit PdxT [Bacillaceae bacterium SIJ1]|uniref:pyridoxal 5'-phosphate synthase glutaminase subunit PdxT n=1 Tax=Litoribacterium kuwaitense TaxID=1398745 RepID=UPI0013EBF280|nr:pyridoxal 5'-phosphate synthase glutaminase subunit PdxT [Litoribacterium kuwaitense]NGP45185.1 pyridoxal 5'-phosphate synthase glutaminase subunit PdxT [Litoribacterium kuwaitense]
MDITIGVLSLQGAFREHVRAVEALGARALTVKTPDQLASIDGLIIPGGESTAIRKLMDAYGFIEPLKSFAEEKPVFGTCAGLIMLAARIQNSDHVHLGLIDMTVERNAFGRQRESFEETLHIEGVADAFEAVFIRAPSIVSVGSEVNVLARLGERIVAVQQKHWLATAFHPELTGDHRMTEHFLKLVQQSKAALSA